MTALSKIGPRPHQISEPYKEILDARRSYRTMTRKATQDSTPSIEIGRDSDFRVFSDYGVTIIYCSSNLKSSDQRELLYEKIAYDGDEVTT